MLHVTPTQFRKMRQQLCHSQGRTAALFGVSTLSVINWEKGRHAIPGAAQILMFLLWDEQINGNRRVVKDFINLYMGT
jgi:DNA-binding transcriptional regulator YiaG